MQGTGVVVPVALRKITTRNPHVAVVMFTGSSGFRTPDGNPQPWAQHMSNYVLIQPGEYLLTGHGVENVVVYRHAGFINEGTTTFPAKVAFDNEKRIYSSTEGMVIITKLA